MSDWHPQEPTELDELNGCSENILVKKSFLKESDFSEIFLKARESQKAAFGKDERKDAYLGKKRPPSIMETNITDQLKNAGIRWVQKTEEVHSEIDINIKYWTNVYLDP